MQINTDNPPAFPHGPLGASFTGEDGYTSHQGPASAGMSLRDYFAGQALTGLIRTKDGLRALNGDAEYPLEKNLAFACYGIADAMLSERDKHQPMEE